MVSVEIAVFNQRMIARPVASGRHQGGQENYKRGGVTFGSKYSLINLLLLKTAASEYAFLAKKRRNSVKSNAAVRLLSNVR